MPKKVKKSSKNEKNTLVQLFFDWEPISWPKKSKISIVSPENMVLATRVGAIGIEVRTRGPFWVPINRIFQSKIKFSRRFFDLFGHLDRFFDAESRAEHDENNHFYQKRLFPSCSARDSASKTLSKCPKRSKNLRENLILL